jgi:hypothetical protein
MQVIVVGSGKLARELLAVLDAGPGGRIVPWRSEELQTAKSIVVHAGSGREIGEVRRFCEATQSALVELATGSVLEAGPVACPVILCPNTNIRMLKFMAMLGRRGELFRGYRIGLVESHQAGKTSVPGTAVSMAESLGLDASEIRSVRDAQVQQGALTIPPEHLARHAFHEVVIEDGACSIRMETRVYGDAPYANGVAQIVAAVRQQALENRRYSILEFIDHAWV